MRETCAVSWTAAVPWRANKPQRGKQYRQVLDSDGTVSTNSDKICTEYSFL